jgi:hypothetical protein
MSCPSVLVVHVLEIEYGGLPVKVAVFVMALSIRDGLVSGPLGFGAALATSVIGTSAWITGRTQP